MVHIFTARRTFNDSHSFRKCFLPHLELHTMRNGCCCLYGHVVVGVHPVLLLHSWQRMQITFYSIHFSNISRTQRNTCSGILVHYRIYFSCQRYNGYIVRTSKRDRKMKMGRIWSVVAIILYVMNFDVNSSSENVLSTSITHLRHCWVWRL